VAGRHQLLEKILTASRGRLLTGRIDALGLDLDSAAVRPRDLAGVDRQPDRVDGRDEVRGAPCVTKVSSVPSGKAMPSPAGSSVWMAPFDSMKRMLPSRV
jgi:hypothetical protein